MTAFYDGPVIDPHHHLWDLSLGRHPWLKAQRVVDGASRLRRDYGISDYLSDAARQNIVATVHVEAGWSDDHPLEETRWLDGLEKKSGLARRYIARVPLDRTDAMARLAAEASNLNVVGIRDIVSWHPDPARSFAQNGGRMSDPLWRAGLREATRLGLTFDLMLFPWQMAEALALVRDHADTVFILNHCGSPIDRSPEGMDLWRKGLRALGAAQNIRVKISDLVAYDNDWTLESLRPVIEHCIECFGAERAMFASDFPVAGLHASFDDIYGVFRAVSSQWSIDEQRAVFYATADTTYGLNLSQTTETRKSAHV